jgi:hypothetical protein
VQLLLPSWSVSTSKECRGIYGQGLLLCLMGRLQP